MRFAAFLTIATCAACAATVNEGDRQSAQIHYDIAIANLNQGEMRGALRELLTATQLDPTLSQAHNALGLVYHSMGRREEALEHYEKAIELRPSFSDAYNNVGILLIDLGRYDDAIAAFERALSDILYATPSLAEGNMGWAYYLRGDVTSAEKHLRNAVATNPKFCRGYEWLARIGLDKGKPDQAVGNVKRFEKYCAGDADIARTVAPDYLRQMKYFLGQGYLKGGDREAARRTFDECAAGAVEAEFATKCAEARRALE